MATDIRFYHLTRNALEQVLPELLEKTLERGWRAVVMAASEERVEALAQMLWTYRPDRFLPHGTAKDGHPDKQPVWLTDRDERPNNAQVLFLVDGASCAAPQAYERVCEIFDGNDENAVAGARQRWKRYSEKSAEPSWGFALSYWQQGPKGWVDASLQTKA